MRKTKIICTLGPAVDDDKKITQLIQAGMDCARLNFSHGTHEEQKVRFDRVRRISEELNVFIPVLLDTKGPEIIIRLQRTQPKYQRTQIALVENNFIKSGAVHW